MRATVAVILLAVVLLAAPASADPHGSIVGSVIAVSYPIDTLRTCAVGLSTIGFPHKQFTVYVPKRFADLCPVLFAGDVINIHFRLEPFLCGPDICAQLWATEKIEKN